MADKADQDSLQQSRAGSDRPGLYEQFLQVFMEFYGQGGRPEPEEAVPRIHERMKEIFKDDADLLQEFEAFLPNNHVTRQTAA